MRFLQKQSEFGGFYAFDVCNCIYGGWGSTVKSNPLEHNSLNLDQFKVKLCSHFKVLERPLCAKYGTRRSSFALSHLSCAGHAHELINEITKAISAMRQRFHNQLFNSTFCNPQFLGNFPMAQAIKLMH